MLFVLTLLLIVPLMAVAQLRFFIPWPYLLGYGVLISGVTYLTYWHDKRRAAAGGQRTPEITLHTLEALGGWPAAFLAQRIIRHKIVKWEYQVAYCAIVIVHEFAAVDYLRGWPMSLWVYNEVLQALAPAPHPLGSP